MAAQGKDALNKPKRILIVEDEVIVAEIAALTLEDAGHQVLDVCLDADTAIERIRELSPDLALIDINLGQGGSGFDVARFAAQRGCAFAFVTAQADAATRAEAMTLGPCAYVLKPYRPVELLDTVGEAA